MTKRFLLSLMSLFFLGSHVGLAAQHELKASTNVPCFGGGVDRTIYKPSVGCGFNDLGVPKMGEFICTRKGEGDVCTERCFFTGKCWSP